MSKRKLKLFVEVCGRVAADRYVIYVRKFQSRNFQAPFDRPSRKARVILFPVETFFRYRDDRPAVNNDRCG